MSTDQIKEITEEYVLHTYNRLPIALERGEGVYLYDTEGKKYLDFAAGIAVCALGYSNEAVKSAVKNQVDALIHTSNLYYNVPLASAGEKLVRAAGLGERSKAFFTNSGTEAIEGAIKAARKVAWGKGQKGKFELIAMRDSFHGRSMGSLSVTGNDYYQEPFRPLVGGVRFATLNDLASVKEQVSDATCAILVEPVQGEGGIHPADPEFLTGLRALCDERDILLIFDEIQCGMGRTGEYYAWQGYGVAPDILTTAKALGCGLPVGAFVVKGGVAENSLAPGDHGTTYGGNPLVCAAVSAVLDQFEELKIVDHVRELTPYLEQRLDSLISEDGPFVARRGKGFLQGLVVRQDIPVGEIITKARERGLLVISAGGNVLRLAPPLIITKEDIDAAVEMLQ